MHTESSAFWVRVGKARKESKQLPSLGEKPKYVGVRLVLFFSPKPLSDTSAALATSRGRAGRRRERRARRGRAEARAGREWLPSWALQFARTGRPRTPEAF